MELVISIVACVGAFTLLIFIHECGHFIVAKLLRVRVLCFSIGFGKKLITFHDRQKTEYAISAIPLGGYVKLLGETDEKVKAHEEKFSFTSQSPFRRMLIIVAGPLFNLLLAFVALWVMFIVGVTGVKPIIGFVEPGSLAQQMGLRANQRILAMDGRQTPTWQMVRIQLLKRMGESGQLLIQTQNMKTRRHTFHRLDLSAWQTGADHLGALRSLGIRPKRPTIPPIIDHVEPNSPAAQIGIQPQDKVISANGQRIHDFFRLTDILALQVNKPVKLVLLRNRRRVAVTVVPKSTTTLAGNRIGRIGIYSKGVEWPKDLLLTQKYSPLQAISPALDQGWWLTKLTVNILVKMVKGDISWRYIGGPISIIRGFSASASYGFGYFLMFLALVNISLGIVNLLPIPVLDGGYLVYYTVELIIRRPIPARVQRFGMIFGVLLLTAVVILALFNDFTRFW